MISFVAQASSAGFYDSAATCVAKDPRKAIFLAAGVVAGVAIGAQVVYEMLPSVKRQRAEEQRVNKLKLINWNIQSFEDIVNAPLDSWIDSVLEQKDTVSIMAILCAAYGNDNPLGRAYNSVRIDLKGLSFAAEKENEAHNALILFDYEYSDQEEVLNMLKERLSATKVISDIKQEKIERCCALLKQQEGFFEQYKACEDEYVVLLNKYIEETEQAERDVKLKMKQVKNTTMVAATVGLLAYTAFSYYTARSCNNQASDAQQEKQQEKVDKLVEKCTDFWN